MMDVVLEIGNKRTFAGALDWPGWCRSAGDENTALAALLAYGPRYQKAIASANLDFAPPVAISALRVVERLKGGAGTDFGAPGMAPAADSAPAGEADALRFHALREALWETFLGAARSAAGFELRKGPRGGGRSLEQIIRHVLDAEMAYLGQLGWKLKEDEKEVISGIGAAPSRQVLQAALVASARAELPGSGPRSGKRWTARFYARYSAWHLLDHAWEIEDRVM